MSNKHEKKGKPNLAIRAKQIKTALKAYLSQSA